MKLMTRSFALILLLILKLNTAGADVAVLVHGYMSDAGTWYYSGIDAQLQQAGWNNGTSNNATQSKSAGNTYYTVQIPSMAPAIIQSDWLHTAIESIEKAHPKEKITLIGHSAGGVVSRLMLVRYGSSNIEHLITLAAPHLGTDRAVQALEATDNSGLFGFVKEWLVRDAVGSGTYEAVRHSRGILLDLAPPMPGSMLFWLNSQPHPDIAYTSVVRTSGYAIAGDILVPSFSQDMNQVPSLRGKSAVILSTQGHELSPVDGRLLVDLL